MEKGGTSIDYREYLGNASGSPRCFRLLIVVQPQQALRRTVPIPIGEPRPLMLRKRPARSRQALVQVGREVGL